MDLRKSWNPHNYNEKHAYVFQYGENLIALLNPKKGERILDVGCGGGQLTAQIHAVCGDTLGIDSSAEMIINAQENYPQLAFEIADAANFRVDQPFDAVFSNAALHWVKDYQGAILSMYQCLKTGGRLVLEMGGEGNVQTIVRALRSSLERRGFVAQAQLEMWYFPSLLTYATLLENQGFRVMLAQHYDRPTEMPSNARGIIDWLSMFADAFFEGVPEKEQELIKKEVQESIKADCFKDGKWYADYKRLRIMAIKR